MTGTKKKFGPFSFVLLLPLVLSILVSRFGNPAMLLVQTSSAVQIPPELAVAFDAFVFMAVTAGLLWLFKATGFDLTGMAQTLAASLSAFLLALAQGWINVAPASWDQGITIFLNILLVVLTGLGMFFVAAGGHKSLLSD